jgi:hypothetical protein
VRKSKYRLPPEKRRPITSRINDVLADPRAISCRRCKICSTINPQTAQMALYMFDDFAKSGMWPIDSDLVYNFLKKHNLAGGPTSGRNRIARFLNHRRKNILADLVRKEIAQWGVLREEPPAEPVVTPPPAPEKKRRKSSKAQ